MKSIGPYRCLTVASKLALPLRLALLGTLQQIFLLSLVVGVQIIPVCVLTLAI